MGHTLDHLVFISYASQDRSRVSPYYDWLKLRGVHVWMDYLSIKPGQNWDFEIKRALDKSHVVVLFISNHSCGKRGYVQREINIVLDKLEEKLIEDIYVIPVLLDEDVDVPDQLKGVQAISAGDAECKDKIYDALLYQFERLGIEAEKTQKKEDLYWNSSRLVESWDGLPGYDFQAELLSFSSKTYPNVGQIGEFLRGHFISSLFTQRFDKLSQNLELYNYGQDRFRRTNTFDAHSGAPVIKGRVLTLAYTVDMYGAGAAHPNYYFDTFSFVLEPLVRITSLKEFFIEEEAAFLIIQKEAREHLYSTHIQPDHDDLANKFTVDWIDGGTSQWSDFDAFILGEEKVSFLFAPYQVAAYAFGAQSVDLDYRKIVRLMRPELRSALEIEHLQFLDNSSLTS